MPIVQLDKAYNSAVVETRLYQEWESRGYFIAPVRKDRKPFVVMMPPPNVTGILTIGHVLVTSLQDILIRWHRMLGEDTLWLPGTDHAGIATQIKVEAALHKEGLTRHDLGREKLVEKIWEWKEHHGGIILKQLRYLGASCDWSRERFTLDPGLSRAVATMFVRLYEKGLIYRGKRIVNWDPVSRTALSDEQVDYRTVQSHLWHIRYPLTDGSGYLVVATTRPETMLGDTAVAVHPEDFRYTHLHGKTVTLPLVGKKIPIVPDNYVDREFGTGCVKVTPAHDPNDFEIGGRHKLEFVVVIGPDGHMTDQVPECYRGLTREECRKHVAHDLEAQDLLERTEPYSHQVGHNERTGVVIEPLLSEQWFVSMKGLAEPAIRAVRSGEVQFYPKHWEKTYFHWMENVRDWCISRQLWWGHRIPLWTVKETGEVICSADDPSKNPKHAGLTLEQDTDVLDTWFSSWLWTFSTLGWPDNTEDLQHFHPTSVLVTGPDIIFLWVARMIMASEEVMGTIPFSKVYFNGIVRDMRGRKLSKSLGNSPDPLDVIAQYGTDALRFTMVSQTPLGGDIRFGPELCEMGRNFANKIWNASRLLFMNLPEEGDAFAFTPVDCLPKAPDNLIDRWIMSAFFSTTRNVTLALEEMRFADAAKLLYAFVWNDFCDWYLELIKPRLQNGGAEKSEALANALGVLHGILRLLHPYMPFITEEIYQQLRRISENDWPAEYRTETILFAPYPQQRLEFIDSAVEEEFALLEDVVNALRNIRGELRLAKQIQMPVAIVGGTADQIEFLKKFSPLVEKLAGLEKLSFESVKPKGSAAAIVHGLEVCVPLGGLIDPNVERARLVKEQDRLNKLLQGAEARLSNPQFIENADPAVVDSEREKLSSLRMSLGKVNKYIAEINSINEG
ncbi:valine--tRNA ligase [candidate division KSB1 bacterium]|nr:MAG: valine--tRNA ligase [candidate division KSB1 bacterium]